MTRSRLRSLASRAAIVPLLVGAPSLALADPDAASEATTAWGGTRSLLEHFGIGVAHGLLRGGDGTDLLADRAQVLRGIDRAVGIGTADAVATVVQLLHDPHGAARSDSVVLVAATRALAPFAGQRAVAYALGELVTYPPVIYGLAHAQGEESGSTLHEHDGGRLDRIELARNAAALALAQAGTEDATELLIAAAGRAGPGRTVATRALLAFPPVVISSAAVLTPEAIMLAAALGDQRAADAVLAASGAVERSMRLAGLEGLGALRDTRGLAVAEAASEDPDPQVREAATGALVDLDAKSAARAVRRLIESNATASRGIALSSRVSGEEVVGALAARLRVSADLPLRRAAALALGRQDDAQALAVLADLLSDPLLGGDVAEAVARTRSPAAWGIIARTLAASSAPLRRLGARMAALRGRLRGLDETPRDVVKALRDLSRSGSSIDRGTALLALILIGERDPSAALEDAEVDVRRAAAMASEPTDLAHARALAARLARETDPLTRSLLARGDPRDETTTALLELVRGGGIDAPAAMMALARSGDEGTRPAIDAAIASTDPLLRACAARGLGQSPDGWATGRLAVAYEAEVDPGARLAIVRALAVRTADADVPLRARTLDRASRSDPEPSIRAVAERAKLGLPLAELPSGDDLVWLRLMTPDGSAPPAPAVRGVVVRADGRAVPVVFDGDGYALVPAPTGVARLVLAPRLPP